MTTLAPRRFAVGQKVRMRHRVGLPPSVPTTFVISGYLPLRDDVYQYRVRGTHEKHDRVIAEDELDDASQPPPQGSPPDL
jgi:hypothetical protein